MLSQPGGSPPLRETAHFVAKLSPTCADRDARACCHPLPCCALQTCQYSHSLALQMEKYQLVAHLNIPYRDLRILDPLAPIPYPTTIFIREKALVVNLESIRMIICQDQASPRCCCLRRCSSQDYERPETLPV